MREFRERMNFGVLGYVFVVVLLCGSHVGEGCLGEEREALLEIRDSINSPNGTSLSGWQGENCCGWGGVSCNNSTSRITHIRIYRERGEALGGWYPNASLFAQFKELTNLYLSWNYISGWEMPQDLCTLANLKILDLSSNNLNNDHLPSCLSNLSELERLNLRYNKLNGPLAIPTGLCGLKKLRDLDLSSNNLDDQILPCLGNLTSLDLLDLTENNLGSKFISSTGELGRLTNLRELRLETNHLTDESIAPWIENLTSLMGLWLANNNLKSRTVTGICKLRNLKRLDLRNNSIESTIPSCITDLHSLLYLYLSNNRLVGPIQPFLFSNFTQMYSIDISNNQLSGIFYFSVFANLSKLWDVDLSYNVDLEVETETPNWVPTFQLSSLYLEGCNLNKRSGNKRIPSFILMQRSLYILFLGYNSLTGTIPPWLLYNSTSLRFLSLRGNHFEGSFPPPSEYNRSVLEAIDISGNNFHGQLSPSISTVFGSLVYFNASANAFQGTIPLSVGQLQSLEVLDLSNNELTGGVPDFLTNIPSPLRLSFLSLANNHLEGEMLTQNSSMPQLLSLLMSDNNFVGTIPLSLLNSTSLMFLDVRRNRISGPLPSWLGQFPSLVSLLAGSNNFIGSIPKDICQLQDLHVLDLSNNSFSETIPSCVSNISSWKEVIPVSVDKFQKGATTYTDPKIRNEFRTKGIDYSYEGIPLTLMTGIDLSMNKLVGDIPPQLGDLRELRSLNLSLNRLSGPLPESLGNMESIESLDISYNNLVGRIPFQLTLLDFLSTFRVRYNNLSGMIPYQNHFVTYSNSSFEGNPDLCGQPLNKNCSFTNLTPPSREEQDEDSEILNNKVIFYSLVAVFYALGFWVVLGVLILKENWRQNWFKFVDKYIGLGGEKLLQPNMTPAVYLHAMCDVCYIIT